MAKGTEPELQSSFACPKPHAQSPDLGVGEEWLALNKAALKPGSVQ